MNTEILSFDDWAKYFPNVLREKMSELAKKESKRMRKKFGSNHQNYTPPRRSSKRSIVLLDISENPRSTLRERSERLGLTKSAIANAIRDMRSQGYLRGKGIRGGHSDMIVGTFTLTDAGHERLREAV